MGERTPTPWRVCDSHPQRACIYIKPEEGWGEIATLYGGFYDRDVKDEDGIWQNDHKRMATAAFIVKACNAHDDLVKALKDILEANDSFRAGMPDGWEGDPMQDACIAARQILASVKERA